MIRSQSLAALVLVSLLPNLASAQSGELEMTNVGVWRANNFTGHVLTPAPAAGAKAAAVVRVLYAPADADDMAYRAQIAAAIGGGAIVDYFDARNATPDNVLLSTYDGVHTFTQFKYLDNVAFGDNLATYSDTGGNVVLGVFCAAWAGKNSLSGAIMGPIYSPVLSPSGSNLFSGSTYTGDGATCLNTNVAKLDVNFRDDIVPQGSGVIDGTFLDGVIATAYRPLAGTNGGLITYSNGSGAVQFSGSGDWANVIANAVTCQPGNLPGTCTSRSGLLGLNPQGYACVTLPSAGFNWQTKMDVAPSVGTSTLQTLLITSLTGPTNNVPIFGYEMLSLPPYLIDANLGAHKIFIPPGTSGLSLSTQGVRLETDGLGGIFIVLLNAQDIVIG